MFRRFELVGALLVCVGAVFAGQFGSDTSIVPIGFLAGLAAVGSPTYSDAVIRGGKAGALGGILFVSVAGISAAAQMASIIGPLFAIDAFLFTGFAMIVMLLPLYSIEGLVAAPLVQWVGSRAKRRIDGTEVARRR